MQACLFDFVARRNSPKSEYREYITISDYCQDKTPKYKGFFFIFALIFRSFYNCSFIPEP